MGASWPSRAVRHPSSCLPDTPLLSDSHSGFLASKPSPNSSKLTFAPSSPGGPGCPTWPKSPCSEEQKGAQNGKVRWRPVPPPPQERRWGMKGEDSHTGLETLRMGVGAGVNTRRAHGRGEGPHTLTLWPFSPGSPGSPSKPRSPYTKRHPLSLESLTLTVPPSPVLVPSPTLGPVSPGRPRAPSAPERPCGGGDIIKIPTTILMRSLVLGASLCMN